MTMAVMGKTALNNHKAPRINVLEHKVINIDRQSARGDLPQGSCWKIVQTPLIGHFYIKRLILLPC
jgi:hypothetical protein